MNCPLDHGTDEQGNPAHREAAPGLVLCRPHRHRLERDIADLPELYDALELMLRPSGPALKPYTTGQGEEPTFVSGLVATTREQIVRTLTSWVVLVAEERGLQPPADTDPHVLAPWLARHAEWISAQPFADEPAEHFRELSGEAYRRAYPTGRHRVVCGRCLEVTACDVVTKAEQRCEGSLVVEWTEPADLEPEGVDCTVCGKTWPHRYWQQLGQRLREVS